MDESFLALLLEGIEHYNEQPDTEQLAELYLTLVLAFNLQYTTHSSSLLPSETLPNGVGEGEETGSDIVTTGERKLSQGADMKNLIIKIMAQQKETKYFTEKLLLLFNREGKQQKRKGGMSVGREWRR